MTKTHLVIPDQHDKPGTSKVRADWLAKLIIDVKPDVVVNIGDGTDMESLCSYETRNESFVGKSYGADIDSWLEFQDRMWSPVRATKKKLPKRIQLEGNHEERIKRALATNWHLKGAIGTNDLDWKSYNDVIVEYKGDTPGIYIQDGIAYAHYFTTGVMGRAVSGEHPAYTLVSKNFQSCVQGHTHTLDYCIRSDAEGNKVMGLICGVYQDYWADWAGNRNDLWHRGVCLLHDVDDGHYDLEFISINRLARAYGGK